MIQLLNSILNTEICTISEKNDKFIIYASDSTYPEDYVEVDYSKNQIVVTEIHRCDEKTIIETKDDKRACFIAGVLALRLFLSLERDELVEQLRSLVKDNLFEDAHRLLMNHFSSIDYEIGEESYDKISLIQTGDFADVKYHSEYLAQGAGLPRAYAVLYNYCKRKKFIETWCLEKTSLVGTFVDINELVELYMLGYIK